MGCSRPPVKRAPLAGARRGRRGGGAPGARTAGSGPAPRDWGSFDPFARDALERSYRTRGAALVAVSARQQPATIHLSAPMRPILASAALLAAASGAAAQQPHHDHAAPRAAARSVARAAAPVITVTARDFAFDAPDTVAAGVTTVRLVNRGPELHHVQLMRLDDGKTMADLLAAFKAGGPPPRWAVDVGGPNTPVPGAEAHATLDLAPGRYAIGCFIPSADKTPHIAKGMVRELVVTGARRAPRPPSAAAPATITLDDYSFTLSRPLVAGRQTVRVRNRAAQSHEVFFMQLAPGKRAADVVAWVDKQEGPPPGRPAGGTTGIAQHGWNDVALDLAPGDYALLCFIPDAKDGKPHFVHGMMKELRVDGPAPRASARGGR